MQVALLEADRLALQASAQESLTALAAQHAAAAASEEELRVVHDALLSEHGELQEEMERMLQVGPGPASRQVNKHRRLAPSQAGLNS